MHMVLSLYTPGRHPTRVGKYSNKFWCYYGSYRAWRGTYYCTIATRLSFVWSEAAARSFKRNSDLRKSLCGAQMQQRNLDLDLQKSHCEVRAIFGLKLRLGMKNWNLKNWNLIMGSWGALLEEKNKGIQRFGMDGILNLGGKLGALLEGKNKGIQPFGMDGILNLSRGCCGESAIFLMVRKLSVVC